MSVAPAFDRRYAVVAGAITVQAITIGCLFAYGVFFKVLEAELGWSRTLLSASSSVAFLGMGMLAIFGGRLSDRHGPRWVLTFTGICTGAGYMLMYFLSAPWQLILLFGLLISVGLSTHDVVTLSTISRWFVHRRGIMTGVVKVGTAVGQLSMPLVATSLIAVFNWRLAFVIMGAAAMLLLLIAAQFMRNPPISASERDTDGQQSGHSLAEARRTPTLWALCAIHFAFLSTSMSVPIHIAAHANDLGLNSVHAALVLSTIGGASIFGRLVAGYLMDRFGSRVSMLCCFMPLLLSLILLRFIQNPQLLFLFAPLYGFAHGGLFTLVSPAVAEFFGMRAHGAIFGQVLFCGTLGGAMGPLLLGLLYDQNGSYMLAFTILAGLCCIGLLLTASLKRTRHEPTNHTPL